MNQTDMQQIVAQFDIKGNVEEIKPLGNGLINTTYKVVTAGDAPDYVLQNVNNAIFPDVEMLMDNIVAVTGHIRKKLEAANTYDIDRKVLSFVPAKDGKYFYFDGDKYWRVMVFIPDTVTKSGVTPESSYIVGETFGDFQAMLADIPVTLGETIKDFHNIEFRLQQLKEAVEADKAGRLAVAVALKPDASINVKQQTIPEMGFQLLLIPAAAYSSGKIHGVGGHGKALLKIQLGL